MPEDQALAVLFLNRKQIELTAETAMIALLSFFALLQPRIELFLREESRAVNALHLRLRSVAFPVSAGERKQLERAQLVRVRHVWTETEIDERRAVDVIDADVSPAFSSISSHFNGSSRSPKTRSASCLEISSRR
jgi:hypothetical protein